MRWTVIRLPSGYCHQPKDVSFIFLTSNFHHFLIFWLQFQSSLFEHSQGHSKPSFYFAIWRSPIKTQFIWYMLEHFIIIITVCYFLLSISFLSNLRYFARIASGHENAQVERRSIWMYTSKFVQVWIFGSFSKVVTYGKCNELMYRWKWNGKISVQLINQWPVLLKKRKLSLKRHQSSKM